MKARTFLSATLAASGLALGTSLFASAQAATFQLTPFTGDDAAVFISLEEIDDGTIDVTVEVDTSVAMADITGIFFNVSNEDILDDLMIVDASPGVQASSAVIAEDDVTEIGNINFQGEPGSNPCEIEGGCDGGIQIGLSGGLSSGKGKNSKPDDYQTVSWTFQSASGDPLTLEDFEGATWGVRLQSVDTGSGSREGSSKLVGTIPVTSAPDDDDDDDNDGPKEIPEPTSAISLLALSAGAFTALRRKSTPAA